MKRTNFSERINDTESMLFPFLATAYNPLGNSGITIYSLLKSQANATYEHRQNPIQSFLIYPFFPSTELESSLELSIGTQNISIFNIPRAEPKISNEKIDKMVRRIVRLYSILGKHLFNKLTYEQMIFMANTAGAIDLGPRVNIDRIYGYLNQY